MALIDELRRLFEELVLPELRAIGAKLDALAEKQKRSAEELASAQSRMEINLIRQLRESEMNILRSVAADLSSQNDEFRKRLKEKKDEPPTLQ